MTVNTVPGVTCPKCGSPRNDLKAAKIITITKRQPVFEIQDDPNNPGEKIEVKVKKGLYENISVNDYRCLKCHHTWDEKRKGNKDLQERSQQFIDANSPALATSALGTEFEA